MAGFEPANEGVKVPCLTAWLHPYWEERAGAKSHPSLFVGWVKGLEPSTPGTTIRCSNQLSYTHHISGITREASPQAALGEMVRQKGFEPPAYCLEGSCSILLSYWRKWMEQVTGIEPASPAWKAGALAIVLHLHAPSAKIVSSVIIASVSRFVNVFSEFFCTFLCYLSRAHKSLAPSALSGRANAPHSRSGCHCTAKTGSVLWPTASTVPSSAQAKTWSPVPSRQTA